MKLNKTVRWKSVYIFACLQMKKDSDDESKPAPVTT